MRCPPRALHPGAQRLRCRRHRWPRSDCTDAARRNRASRTPVSKIVTTKSVDVARRVGSVASMPDVVLPVLDEAGAIPDVLARFPRDYEPIVVDNGSTDGSAKIASNLGARVVIEPVRGFGAACFTGLRATTSDVVCFMDCDGSLDPRDLPLVSSPVLDGEADLVLGARRPTEAGAWPIHARLANRVLARLMARRVGG